MGGGPKRGGSSCRQSQTQTMTTNSRVQKKSDSRYFSENLNNLTNLTNALTNAKGTFRHFSSKQECFKFIDETSLQLGHTCCSGKGVFVFHDNNATVRKDNSELGNDLKHQNGSSGVKSDHCASPSLRGTDRASSPVPNINNLQQDEFGTGGGTFWHFDSEAECQKFVEKTSQSVGQTCCNGNGVYVHYQQHHSSQPSQPIPRPTIQSIPPDDG